MMFKMFSDVEWRVLMILIFDLDLVLSCFE